MAEFDQTEERVFADTGQSKQSVETKSADTRYVVSDEDEVFNPVIVDICPANVREAVV